jgi:predicted dehydrogenase
LTKKTKVGIIGLGGIAQLVHLPILSKLNNVDIEAVAEVNKSRLKAIADKFSIKNRFADYKELLVNPDIEAVVIATPTSTHAEIAIECIQAGKHVLIEKPLGRTIDEANKINAAAKKHKRLAMVGMNLRFRPDAMLLKTVLNSGELGEIFYIKCSWLRKQSSEQNWFMKKSESGGGVISDIGIVLIDLSCWLIDYPDVKSASVQTYKHRTKEVEDSAVGLIRFKNNTVINFEVSWSLHSEQDSMRLTAYGTQGTAQLNPLRAYKRIESTKIDYTPAKSSSAKNLYKKSYENELKHFIGAVRSTNPLRSTTEDILTQMKLLSAIYESSEKHCEINLK